MAPHSDQNRQQPPNRDRSMSDRSIVEREASPELRDWEIDHSSEERKPHPGGGEHFAGNAAETLQAPVTKMSRARSIAHLRHVCSS